MPISDCLEKVSTSSRMRKWLLFTSSVAAIVCGSATIAVADDTEEVVVTASRTQRAGFVAPTPTTVLDASDIAIGGSTNVAQALAALPSFDPSISSAMSRININAGENLANLRALGPTRSLVLIDGQRPVPTDASGLGFGFDLNMVPTYMIKRVDIVTGGASAQWGSDAIAGVINIVLDKTFDGFKFSAQDGGDLQGYHNNEFKADAGFGTSFADGRGHLTIGAGFDKVTGSYDYYRTPAGRSGTITNPTYTATNGQTQLLFVSNILNSTASTGGLITSGPLKGIDFGPGGSIGTFQYGTYGTQAASMSGGDATARDYGSSYVPITPPLVRSSGFATTEFELTPDVTLTADAMLGYEGTSYNSLVFTNLGNLNISINNAFLPNQIKTLMTQNNITSFTLGRVNEDFGSIRNRSKALTQQYTFGAHGNLDGDWKWDAFYSYGQTSHNYVTDNQQLAANYTNAVNAVISPTTGQPVCAVTLTNPASTCVPINLFGQGSVSKAALNYIMATGWEKLTLYQHEVAVNLHGEPLSLWAGPVSVATGFEFRRQGINNSTDPYSAAGQSGFLNYTQYTNAAYTVAEGYGEVVVPLARDLPLLNALDLDAAGRVSGYSTAGTLQSFKLGLVDQAAPGLRVRATLSQDVRAPNLQELFSSITTGSSPVANTVTGVTYQPATSSGGNPNLASELAQTWTGGFTYSPDWLPNVSASVDYYTIKVSNAIASLTAQSVANLCYVSKNANACSNITTVNGAITAVRGGFVNLSGFKDSGVDMELAYATDMDLLGTTGQFRARALTTYISYLKQSLSGTLLNYAGDISAQSLGSNAGLPRWRSTVTMNYDFDQFGVYTRIRVVGGGYYSRTQTVNVSVNDQAYVDLGGSWTLPFYQKGSLYFDVNNAFNNTNTVASTANQTLYDFMGTTYDVGFRFAL